MSIAIALTLGYGVLGFWLLDTRQFGIEFSLIQSLMNTGSLLILSPPPFLVPRTAYGRWFLESLRIPGRRERAFSLGRFDWNYLKDTPFFAVFAPDGRMLAFANIIPSYHAGDTTVDLMRHRSNAPNGTMDFMFIKLFLMSKAQGFRRFDMGMAPMAGFREKEEASREERAVHYFLQHLNFLFSYQGLMHFKSKFATIWEPRYLIHRHVLDLPRIAYAMAKVSELRGESDFGATEPQSSETATAS